MDVSRTTPLNISVSGLRAEALRMKVISNNIANVNTSKTASGEPYRRQTVVLSTGGDLSGVSIESVGGDLSTDFKKAYEPGNPNADADGYVSMPNVDLPTEMMNMVFASRAYQANAAVLKRHQELSEATLELLR